MVDGETAVFFSEQSVDATADALRTVLSREFDPRALAENAGRFSAPRFRERLVATIDAARQPRT
jgi:hypothetical protein